MQNQTDIMTEKGLETPSHGEHDNKALDSQCTQLQFYRHC